MWPGLNTYQFEKLGFVLGLGFRPIWTLVRRMKLRKAKFLVLLEGPCVCLF